MPMNCHLPSCRSHYGAVELIYGAIILLTTASSHRRRRRQPPSQPTKDQRLWRWWWWQKKVNWQKRFFPVHGFATSKLHPFASVCLVLTTTLAQPANFFPSMARPSKGHVFSGGNCHHFSSMADLQLLYSQRHVFVIKWHIHHARSFR